MNAWQRLGPETQNVLAVLGTSALVVALLLNGACGTTPPSGHCWRPGLCHEVESSSSCTSAESFDTGSCSTTLRVGDCVRPDGTRVHLYAPLHGLVPPNCERLAGSGASFERD